ncbi:probable insulin-like peptide 6 [Drosophila elegans]|uniref:probable insulin-like peptide 6 n=1 Tax=Drosophila elegans TaxID=30023 RepID=UPI0007E7376C|nr:probable insulin-like peptide 6 [Drosophila elegans]XP_041566788.1 probable insulin-like peptide 6 [Drosophila elegans]
MIPEVPTSRILLVLANLIAVLVLISSWVPQVASSPLAPVDYEQRRVMCSTNLSEFIQGICESGTVSYGDRFPNSFGKRRKRDVQYVADQCCKPGGCTYTELLKYCKE